MASSAALTTTHLPQLRQELEAWREKQPSAQPFTAPLEDIVSRLNTKGISENHGKDVIVAFRTRPPLEHEAENKFHISTNADDGGEEGQAITEFCSGVSLANAEPGVFVAHVPGMKASTDYHERRVFS
jgi:kinesin family member 2/24